MTKHRLLRWSLYFLELVLLFLIQQAPLLLPSLGGVRPVLLFAAALSVAMFEGDLGGMTIGIAAGFLTDFAGNASIGFHCILLAVLCFFIGRLTMQVLHTNLLTCLLCGAVALAVLVLAQWLFFHVFSGQPAAARALTAHYLPKALYTFGTLPIFYLINRVFALRLAESD